MAPWLRRGALAGFGAGVGAGLFLLVIGEPLVEQALTFEASGEEVFTRAVQRRGLLAATVLEGLVLGALLGVASGRLRPIAPRRVHRLVGACFVVLWLAPFVKYPADPPAVSDPETIGHRTALYLAMLGASAVAALLAAWLASRLGRTSVPESLRGPVVVMAYLALTGTAFALLPSDPAAVSIPAELLWNVRLVSLGGQTLLWGLLAIFLGLVAELHRRHRATQGPLGEPAP